MKCPYCGKDAIIGSNKLMNIEAYGSPITVLTECCGRGLRLYRKIIIYADKYTGSEKIDDWGCKIKNDN